MRRVATALRFEGHDVVILGGEPLPVTWIAYALVFARWSSADDDRSLLPGVDTALACGAWEDVVTVELGGRYVLTDLRLRRRAHPRARPRRSAGARPGHDPRRALSAPVAAHPARPRVLPGTPAPARLISGQPPPGTASRDGGAAPDRGGGAAASPACPPACPPVAGASCRGRRRGGRGGCGWWAPAAPGGRCRRRPHGGSRCVPGGGRSAAVRWRSPAAGSCWSARRACRAASGPVSSWPWWPWRRVCAALAVGGPVGPGGGLAVGRSGVVRWRARLSGAYLPRLVVAVRGPALPVAGGVEWGRRPCRTHRRLRRGLDVPLDGIRTSCVRGRAGSDPLRIGAAGPCDGRDSAELRPHGRIRLPGRGPGRAATRAW